MSEELEWELYEIFESGLFAFPIWDHSSARAVVRYLMARGVIAEEIADAIEDSDTDLSIWLNHSGKHMVGEWVISWINETRDEYLQERALEEYELRHPAEIDEVTPSIADTSETGSGDFGSQTDIKQIMTSDLESNASPQPPHVEVTTLCKEADSEDGDAGDGVNSRPEDEPPALPPRNVARLDSENNNNADEEEVHYDVPRSIDVNIEPESNDANGNVDETQYVEVSDELDTNVEVGCVDDNIEEQHYINGKIEERLYANDDIEENYYVNASVEETIYVNDNTEEALYVNDNNNAEPTYDLPKNCRTLSRSSSASMSSLGSSIPLDINIPLTNSIPTCLTETITHTSAFMQSELMRSGQGTLPKCPNCTCKLLHYSYTSKMDDTDTPIVSEYEPMAMDNVDTPSPVSSPTPSEYCQFLFPQPIVKAMQINLVTLDKDGPGYIFVLTDCLDKCLPWAGDCCYKVASSRLPERHLMEFKLRAIEVELVWQVRVQHHVRALKEVQGALKDYSLNTNWFRCPLATIVDAVAKVAKRYREEE